MKSKDLILLFLITENDAILNYLFFLSKTTENYNNSRKNRYEGEFQDGYFNGKGRKKGEQKESKKRSINNNFIEFG